LLHGLCFCHGLLTYCLSAMQYGKQTVPISSEEENHLKYLPEKDMQAIGFVSLDQIPRHMYMKVLSCLSACLLFVPWRQPVQTAKTGNQIQCEWSHCTPVLAVVCLEYQVWRRTMLQCAFGHVLCQHTEILLLMCVQCAVRTQVCAESGSSCSCSVQSRLICLCLFCFGAAYSAA